MAALKEESEYEETFKKGTIVEVSSEDEGLRGSWYTATVIRTISRKTHKILVEYHNLMEDNAGSKPLREYVDAILVRPIPPREPHLVFSLMDDVDAFHNDGWWEGVVTQVVLDSSSSYFYSVFFRCSREQILFGSSDLRLHREWVRANVWVPPFLHFSSPSSGQRKRSDGDGRKGNQDMAIRDGGERDVRRRIGNTPTKYDAFVKNGGCKEERRSSNGSVDDMVLTKGKDGSLRISSNGLSKEHASVKNGSPRQNAITNAVDNQDLPFSKNSRVWEMIESMEVLMRVPQKPHFQPLYNCKEECREGLAIGSMVTFTSLVERISKSQFSDPKSVLDGYLEALVDLEELGFNVAPVREKLTNMISIKGRFEQAQNTSKATESQIMELNLEKSYINEEIVGIDKRIGELMEKRSLAMVMKERKNAEITVLQSSIDSVKSELESAEREFLNATTSLW